MGRVNDPNRANNLGVYPLTIALSPSPDLAITALTPATSGFAGQPLIVVWTTANRHPTGATGRWYDAVYLSGDATLDSADVRLDVHTHEGGLVSSGQYIASTTITLPRMASGIGKLGIQVASA